MPKLGMEPIRRARVINAALECISDTGIDGITLEMVSWRAECSKGVVAYYFKSKRNLVLEALKAFLSYYQAKSGGEIHEGMKADEMLGIVVGHGLPPYAPALPDSGGAINVSALEGADRMHIPADKKARLFIQFFSRAALDADIQTVISEAYRKDVEGIKLILRHGVRTEAFQPCDPEIAAYGLMAMFVGLSFFRVAGFALETGADNRSVCADYLAKMLGKASVEIPE